MTVLAGSLDYLYYNGILDHIPYEVYQLPAYGNQNYSNPLRGIKEQFATNPQLNTAGGIPNYNGLGMPPSAQNYGTNTNSERGINYLDNAMHGDLYTYTAPDTFVRRNNSDIQTGQDYAGRFETIENGYDSFKNSVRESVKKTKASISEKTGSDFFKGILSAGVLLTTLVLLFRGKHSKISVKDKSKGFISKLNPKNWFKNN